MPEPKHFSELILKSSVRSAVDVVGDRWTMLIVLGAFYGYTQFEDWLHSNKMSSSVLSNRLIRLQKHGILHKEQIGNSRITSYQLTPSGLDLFPWALALWNWEHHWLYQEGGHPVSIVHSKCGNNTLPKFDCHHCGLPMKWGDISTEKSPGFESARITKLRASRRSIVSTDSGKGSHNFGRIVDLLGDHWSYLILAASYYGIRKFDDFQRELDIGPNTLSDRLKRLLDHGMLARSRYQEAPERWEYIQTVKTLDFTMVPMMLGLWADKWLTPAGKQPPIIRVHNNCGKQVEVDVLCTICKEPLRHEEVKFQEEK